MALALLMVLGTLVPLTPATVAQAVDPCSDVEGPYQCESIAYDWREIAATGTNVGDASQCDDCVSGPLALPFPFLFYGSEYSFLNVSSNGFVSFTSTHQGCCSGQAIPDPYAPNGVIAAYWTDLYPNYYSGSAILTGVAGQAPEREFIIEWHNLLHYSCGNGATVTTEIILHETTNVIEIQSDAANSDSCHRHTTGIENPDGTLAVRFRYGLYYSLGHQDSVRFVPHGVPTPPLDFRATLQDRSVALAWDPPADTAGLPILGYRITRTDGQSATPTNFPLTSNTFATDSGLLAGHDYTYTVAAVTSNGTGFHSAPQTVSVPIVVPPTPTITLDPADPTGLGGWYNSSVAATFGATQHDHDVDLDTIAYSFDGESYTLGTHFDLPEGTTALWARANDTTGETGVTGPVFVSVDTTPPTVSISDARQATTDRDITLVLAFGEPMDPDATLAAIENVTSPPWTASWNGGDACDCEFATETLPQTPNTVLTLTRAGADFGAYTITVGPEARDAHGNHVTGPTPYSFDVTQPAPVTTLTLDTEPNEAGWFTSVPTATLSATPEGATIHYALDDGAEQDYAAPLQVPAGVHTVHYRATAPDLADEYPQEATLHVDTSAPSFGGFATDPAMPAPGDDVTITLAVSDDVSGVASVALYLGDAPLETSWSDGVATAVLADAPAGSYSVTAVATDQAGNAHESEEVGTFDVARPATPGAPYGLTVEYLSDHVHLAWHAPDDEGASPILRYDIYRSTPCGCAALASEAPTPYASTTSTSYDDTNAEPGVLYSYSVVAVNEQGSSPVSPTSEPFTVPPRTTLALDPATPDGTPPWYAHAPAVTLTAAPAGASIVYAWDDDTPAPYAAPLTAPEGVHTLHYHATLDGGPTEGDRTATFHVDLTPPTVTLSGSEGTIGTRATLVLAFSEPMDRATVEGALTGADGFARSWNDASTQLTLRNDSLDDGPRTIVLGTGARDAHGVPTTEESSRSFTVDSTAPHTMASLEPGAPDDGAWFTSAPTITLSATPDGSSIVYAWDDAEPAPYSGPFVALEGAHVLHYHATLPDHQDEADQALDVRVESAAPLLHVTPDAPASGWHLASPSVTVEGAGDLVTCDGEGCAPSAPYTGALVLGDGTHVVRARGENATARTRIAETTVRVDLTAPTATASGATGVLATGDADVLFSFSEAMDRASTLAALAGADGFAPSWNDGSTELTLRATGLADGPYAITLGTGALDAHGQPLAAPASRSFIVDRTTPVVTITLTPAAPTGNGEYFLVPVSATISATDPDGIADGSIEVRANDGAFAPATSFAFPEGVTLLAARARDANGHEATASVTVRVDTIRPTVTAGGSQGSIPEGNAVITFAFSEPMATDSVLAALTGAAAFTPSWNDAGTLLTLAATALPPGSYAPTVGESATDAHGGALESGASRSVTVPPPPPPRPLPTPPSALPGAPTGLAATVSGGVVHLAWTPPTDEGTSPVTSYQIRRDGTAFGTASGATFDDGTAEPGTTPSYTVAARNDAGEGPQSASASVPVPLLDAPTSTLALSPAIPDGLASWYLTTPTATLSASPDDATIRYHFDDEAADQTYAAPFTLPVGEHTLRWHAERAGAADEAEHAEAVRIDAAPPTLDSAAFSAPNATLGGHVVLSVRAHDDASGVASAVALLSDGSTVTLSGAPPEWSANLGPGAVGTYPVDVLLTDAAGRETRQSVGSFRIDEAPLEPTSVEPTVTTPAPGSGDSLSPASSGSGGSSGGGAPPGGPVPSAPSGTTSSTPPPAPPPPAVVVTPRNASIDLAAGARGELTVSVQNVDHPERVRYVAVGDDGSSHELGSGESATWDTTQAEDGYYTIEAREEQADGSTLTIASTRILVRNTFLTAGEAVGSIALGVGAAAATSLATSTLTSGAASAATSVATSGGSGSFSLSSYLKDLFVDAGSDSLRDRTRDVASIERRRKMRSAVAVGVTVTLIAVFYSIAEATPISWTTFLEALPFVGVAAVLLAAQKYTTESLIAHATGVRVRFRLWVAGVLSLLASTLVFHEPFGYPGYVDNGTEETAEQKRLAGRRALAILAGTASWGLVFVAIGHLGYYGMANVGISMAVTVLATSAMPFGPLPGAEVWRWNKLASLGVALLGFGVYVTYEMAILPEWAYVTIGAVGAVGYVATTLHYRSKRKPPTRVPVRDADATVSVDVKASPEKVEVK